jgi:hypothetical protein
MGSDILLAIATPPATSHTPAAHAPGVRIAPRKSAAPRPIQTRTAAATAVPAPPNPSRPALDVALVLVILALTIVIFALLGFGAWQLSVSPQRNGYREKWRPQSLTDRRIRALQGGAVLGVLFVLLILSLVWLPQDEAIRVHGAWVTVEFVALGVMLSAGFFGFLFALPRFSESKAGDTPATGAAGADRGGPTFSPSKNLDTVADRFATLVAGAVLSQLATIPSYVNRFATFFSTNLGLRDAGKPLGVAIILVYAPLGFVLAYVATRTIGARAFASSDIALLRTGSKVVAELPVLPDIVDEATPDQRAVAARIAAVPLSTLESVRDRTAWARAQSILKNWKAAETAYQQVLVIDNTNPKLTLEYATVLYNDEAFLEYAYILQLVDVVLELLDANDDDELRSQALSLRAGTNLYVPGGSYIESIVTVNEVLRDPNLQPGQTLRFYRACAFGQLYRGYLANRRIVKGDDMARAIAELVESDVAITLAFGGNLKSQLQAVIDPSIRKKLGYSKHDDDLQQLAADVPALAIACGIQKAVPAPTTKAPDLLPLPDGFVSVKAFVNACPV